MLQTSRIYLIIIIKENNDTGKHFIMILNRTVYSVSK